MAYQDVKTPWEDWHVINEIGRGGFGVVYEVERSQYGIQERAAMKVITIPQSLGEIDDLLIEGYDSNSITQRFDTFAEDIVREYGMMAQMKGNANIVYCDDYRIIQQDNGFGRDIYIRMELLTPLLKAMDRVSSETQIIRFGIEMCNALVACQKRKVIHRDIKPQNIFVSDDGVFKLGDFGIARKAEKTTRATVGKGTYQFMAPEVKNERPYGPTVDIYSLGLVMYWLLNERRSPFLPLPPAVPTYNEQQEAFWHRFSGEQLPAPKDGSRELKRIVLKACAFDPEDRYQSAAEMQADLRLLSGGHVVETAPQPKAAPIPVVQDDLDDKKTEGGSFGHRIVIETDTSDRTVGPVFKPASVVDADDLDKTVGPQFQPKEKRALPDKKKSEWEEKEATLRKKRMILIGAICILIVLIIGCIYDNVFPQFSSDVLTGNAQGSGEADNLRTDELPQTDFLPLIEQNMSRVTATTKVGAVIDDMGQLWAWNNEDRIVTQTSVNNVAGVTVPTIGISGFEVIYFVGVDGTLGFIEYDAAKKTFGNATYIETPVPIIDVEAFGWVVYAIGKDGCLYEYKDVRKLQSPTKTDGIPSIVDLQIFDAIISTADTFTQEQYFIAKGNDGAYYGWGYNAFGKWCNVGDTNITSPVKLNLPSGLQSANFFKQCGTEELMCAAWGEDRTLSISDNQGVVLYDLTDCSAVYAGSTMVYMVLDEDILAAYGRFASGHSLNENTDIFVNDGDSLETYVAEGFGVQIKSFSADGWTAVMLSTDGRIRTWGAYNPDRFLKNADGSDFVLPCDITKGQTEKVGVSLICGEKKIDVTVGQWEARRTQIRTVDLSIGNGAEYEFTGVMLASLMELVGVTECSNILVKSYDGWISEVAPEDAKAYDVLIADAYVGGKEIPADAGGPIKMVFPATEHPELGDRYDSWAWQWFVSEIEFVN